MSGCVVVRGCGAQPCTELRATHAGRSTEWREACYRHADEFERGVTSRGYRFEQRPVGLLREVLDPPLADVIPLFDRKKETA